MNILERPPHVFRVYFAIFLVVFLAVVSFGQATRPVNVVERRLETLNRQAKEFERDNMGRESKKASKEDAARKLKLRQEIEADLSALQTLYNSSVSAMETTRELRPNFAAETARAVEKAASRLRTNLALPELESDAAEVIEKTELPEFERNLLVGLCRHIYKFLSNPIFDNVASIDVIEGRLARSELELVLRFAERLAQGPATPEK